ncbi:hypothetical protein, unlikely [Trypanosoma brucei gambiense DAL972]|uniref:Uncharacterized protein n=1 Tax=Trypanosoma brucei gambiense (strain MHOM/CI/86/DAL972) TaxID=679716 RepID=C9ZNT2_TRYB9|nr:hypothetical protein, unlikely [Trypanosoma brucei gambiense DAL972]CBH11060.1 hypothetical protein, unlikely [Trypanosoma brucei gambiense DAL972]|eukprot:XP_011773347.1 hypothetical protein, unlikely [Trypanosoma brucei gambiense DAL972]
MWKNSLRDCPHFHKLPGLLSGTTGKKMKIYRPTLLSFIRAKRRLLAPRSIEICYQVSAHIYTHKHANIYLPSPHRYMHMYYIYIYIYIYIFFFLIIKKKKVSLPLLPKRHLVV